MLLLVKIKHLFKLGRLGVLETSLPGEEADESDMVELEKSNVLLLGPTGSGISCFLYLRMFFCQNCCKESSVLHPFNLKY